MDFKFNEEQRMFRETVCKFVKKEVAPLVEEAERTETFPRSLLKKCADEGLLAVGLPKEYGGAGGDMTYLSIFVEEMARECAGLALSIYPGATMAMAFATSPSEEQKQKYMMPLIRGESTCALAMTEPNAGSDALAIKTTAKVDGDDYVINGRKVFITNATTAGFFIVVAKKDTGHGPEGITVLLVDRDTPGLTVEKKMDKLGLRSCETAGVVFEDCRIPRGTQWGGKSGGFGGLMTGLNKSRVLIAALSIGIARAAFEASLDYAKTREQFGKPIGKFQSIKNKLVDMAVRIENSRLLTYRAIQLINEGEGCTKEASMAKLYASESAVKITGEAIQVHGGYGYSCEYPVERYFRDAKVLTIFEGTSEIQNIIIARELGL